MIILFLVGVLVLMISLMNINPSVDDFIEMLREEQREAQERQRTTAYDYFCYIHLPDISSRSKRRCPEFAKVRARRFVNKDYSNGAALKIVATDQRGYYSPRKRKFIPFIGTPARL